MNNIIGGIMIAVSSVGVACSAELRQADQLFNAWVSDKSATRQHFWQHVFLPVAQEGFIKRLKKLKKEEKERYALIQALVKKSLKKDAAEGDEVNPKEVKALYGELNKDIGGLIKRLQATGWESNDLNKYENSLHFQTVIDKNAHFAGLLSDAEDSDLSKHQLFCLAQRMFFHLFDDGWKQAHRFFSVEKQFPILRFFYSLIWQSLSGDGWKEWAPECLEALKKQAKRGKAIRYIAGGCDIWALLDAGIFNIEIVDPMLPTQPRYYVRDWEWLVQGALGDEVAFPSGLRLVRAAHDEKKAFMLVPDGKKSSVKIPESTTTWQVLDKKGKACGQVVFERRFCTKHDFVVSKTHALLLSFNELSYITCADKDNWGIEPADLNKKLVVHIKQLYKPVTTRIMQNMHKADSQQFSFIRLGSCVK